MLCLELFSDQSPRSVFPSSPSSSPQTQVSRGKSEPSENCLVIAPRAAWHEKKGKKGGGGRAEDLRAQTTEEQVDPGVSIKQRTYPPVPATRCACALALVQNSDKSPKSIGKEPQLVHHRRHSHFRKESVPRHSLRLSVLPGASVSQRRPRRAGSCSSDPAPRQAPGVFPSPQSQLHWPMQWAA